MASTPYVAIETPTGTTGSDGLAVFTFGADIDVSNHGIVVDRLVQGQSIDYTITGARQVTFASGSIPLAGAQIWLFNGAVATSTSSGLPSWATVATIISDAAVELGLYAADISDPFASTDQNIIQLLRLLRSAGRELVRRREWTHLVREYTFSTVNGTEAYALPTDFRSFVDDSQWDRSTRWQLAGPVSSADWQYLKARTVAGTVNRRYRLWGSQMYLNPTPTSAETIAFEYNSTYWIKPSGQTSATSETPTAATDVVCFDPTLVVRRLKRDFRRAKKQDSTSEEQDYLQSLRDAEAQDSPAAAVYLSGNPRNRVRLIDALNVPETGFGT